MNLLSKLCVTINTGSESEIQQILNKYGFVEFHFDKIHFNLELYKQAVDRNIKTVATLGKLLDFDNDYRNIYSVLLNKQPAYIDLSIASSPAIIKNFKSHFSSKLILSYHDFDGTPSCRILNELIARASDYKADVIKIACRANTIVDVLNLMDLYADYSNLISIPLGKEWGVYRLYSLKSGAVFMYVASDELNPIVEGQLDYETMKALILSSDELFI